MFIFVSGGTRSGKSEWAEQLALTLSRDNPRVYLATARIVDEDMRCRVARHQKARSGRGFLTLERSRDLGGIFHAIPANALVLLECLPNWLANEMFPEDGNICGAGGLEEEIFRTALALRERCRHLLIVSDDIFSDGVVYDEVTESYRRLLGRLHVRLAGVSDAAVECIAGLARCAKGEAGMLGLGLL
ncbi:MAG: bifunctional adenosylcobinamide kinase/adenosylcobinamide-phosphate guanylyltransferase [Fretibacterium sp.]|nr:bifunctional adenosylcobinamide kinase/adenosylcobinamide-phosphate guanylyltransferase [Fretibacterium sp.]